MGIAYFWNAGPGVVPFIPGDPRRAEIIRRLVLALAIVLLGRRNWYRQKATNQAQNRCGALFNTPLSGVSFFTR